MKSITVAELQAQHPEQFRKEYYRWTEHAVQHGWWEYVEEEVKTRFAPAGIEIDRIFFEGFYCQSDYATFTGRIEVAAIMQHLQLDEQYPALYAAHQASGTYLVRSGNRRGRRATVEYDEADTEVPPQGVFAALDQDTWSDLVAEQEIACDLRRQVEETCEDIDHELFYALRQEYEGITSEETFIADSEANETTFEAVDEENDDETQLEAERLVWKLQQSAGNK
jgi:hypothetical protein